MEKLPLLRNWNHQLDRVARFLNVFRIVILFSLLLLLTILQHWGKNAPAIAQLPVLRNEFWLYSWCAAYGLLLMFSVANPQWQRQNHATIPNASSVIDIAMISILSFLLGGISSGFGILVLPFLMSSCLFSYGRYPLLYGSFASALILFESLFRYTQIGYVFNTDEAPLLLTQIILIGAYYLVPITTSFAARHLMRADTSLLKHRIAYDRISILTQMVTNRMQEAAIVVDNTQNIWLLNHKAQEYFPALTIGQKAPFLSEIIERWQKNLQHDFSLTLALNEHEMHVRAIPLLLQNETPLLTLFIRSESERHSEAQTLKLTALGQLTANLAHEIRNPLSAISHANSLLSEIEEGNQPAEKMCRIIGNNIARIDKMIEDISVLNKGDKTKQEIINLHKFWEHFVQEFQLIHPHSSGCLKSQFHDNAPMHAHFDAMHLQQILWNLCNNAWRHSSKTANAIIVYFDTQDNIIRIRVKDDGDGILPENIPRLFEPFFTTQSRAQGTGLGLYVARELAHSNKGDLHYLIPEKLFELTLLKADHAES